MAYVRLACWMNGAAPGDVVEVADDAVKALTRDGRVSEVLPGRTDGGEGWVDEAGDVQPAADAAPARRRRT